jgi:selT/selW/selH-like putative selenoprotein
LAAAISKAHPKATIDKKPGGRGDFRVTVDGKVVWDKNGKDRDFPSPEQVLKQLQPQRA